MDFLITTLNKNNYRNNLAIIITNIDNSSDDEDERLLLHDEDIRSNINIAVNQSRSVIINIDNDSDENRDDNQLPPPPQPSSPISIHSLPPSLPSSQSSTLQLTSSCRICLINRVDTLSLRVVIYGYAQLVL
ncbi:uncharacterized protein [Chelonus insularis]|uniref:uncharacterized protein n=1 Tax=Chelonus insularis TaxID=460826 RepID=UPI00158C67E4|nr:uncharacterized protein LOC118071239 [Chelonus insularis]